MTTTADSGANDERIDEEEIPVRIRATRSLCQGWGECRRWAPEVYFLDDTGSEIGFQFLEVPAELAEASWHGADACPERAIQVLGPRPPRRERLRPIVPSTPTDIPSPEEESDDHDRW